MLERYSGIKEDYKKVKELYDKEKEKINVTNENKKENKLQWHPDLTEEQIDYIKSELDIYEPKGQEYEQALRQLGLDPNKQPKEEKTEKESKVEELFEGYMEVTDPEQKRQELAKELRIDPDELSIVWSGADGQISDDGVITPYKIVRKTVEKPKEIEADLEEPEKPINPVFIKEKEKEQGTGTITPPPDLHPTISFSEILSKTKTKHIGNFAYNFYKFTRLRIIPKNTDTLQKVLVTPVNLALLPIRLAAKIVGAPINIATKIKMNEIRDNIEDLSPEEFAVLTQNAKEANKTIGKKVKDDFDTEYLDTQTMKERKINTAYLDIVGNRLEREETIKLNETNEKIAELEKLSKDIRYSIKETDDLERKQQLEQMLNEAEAQLAENRGKAIDIKNKVDNYKFGVEHKTRRFKDIPGWILAKNEPDTRKFDEEMAEMSKQRREASQRGEEAKVDALTAQMRDKQEDATKVYTIGWNIHNKIDRGINSRTPVTFANMEQQNKGRLLFANAMLASTITRAYTDFVNWQEAQRVNQANSNIGYEVTPADHMQQEINEATTQEAGLRMEAGSTTNEYIETYYPGARAGSHLQEHIDEANMARDGLNYAETTQYLKDRLTDAENANAFATRAPHNDLYTHEGIQQALQQMGDLKGFENLIQKLQQPINGSVSGQMVNYTIDPVTYAGLISSIFALRDKNVKLKAKAKKAEDKAKENESEKDKTKEYEPEKAEANKKEKRKLKMARKFENIKNFNGINVLRKIKERFTNNNEQTVEDDFGERG